MSKLNPKLEKLTNKRLQELRKELKNPKLRMRKLESASPEVISRLLKAINNL